MAKYLLVVPSNAKEGRDEEYNAWYDNVHLAELLTIPGVVSGRRFDAAPQSPSAPPQPYLAIYELEVEDPSTIVAEITRRAGSGEMTMNDALDTTSAQMWIYRVR